MTTSPAIIGTLIGLAVLWVYALTTPPIRTWRCVALLSVVSVVAVAAAIVSGTLGLLMAGGAAVIGAAALIQPALFRVGSVSPAEAHADEVIRALAKDLDGFDDSNNRPPPGLVERHRGALRAPVFLVIDSPWVPVGYITRYLLTMLSGPTPHDSRDRPVEDYRIARNHWWQLALNRRVVGRIHTPTSWDEEVLLASLWLNFQRLLPDDYIQGGFPGGGEGWQGEAATRIEEVSNLRLAHSEQRTNQQIVLRLMRSHIAVAHGDRSEAALDEEEQSHAALRTRWVTVQSEPDRA